MSSKRTLVAFALLVCGGAVFAQPFPSKTVRIVIGVPPGGISDNVARAAGAELSKIWGQPVVVENRPGAADVPAALQVLKSPADGHTIYQTNGSLLMINQLARRNLPFDPGRDFVPVHGLVYIGNVLVVSNASGATSVGELIAIGRKKPGALNYGSLGIGSGPHLYAERFSLLTGMSATHVPYKGGLAIGQGLVSGDVDFAFNGVTSVLGLIKQGRMRAVAWAGSQRSPLLPDVPTLKEQGYGFETGGWLGWFMPTATPRAAIEKISADAHRVLAVPEFRDKYVIAGGGDPLNLPVTQFTDLVKDTRAAFADLLSKVPLKLD